MAFSYRPHLKSLGSWIVISILAGLLTCPGKLSAQTDEGAAPAQPTENSGPELNPNLQPPSGNPNTPTSPDAQTAPGSESTHAQDSSYQQAPVTNLETGLPLRSTMSPLHWGHLSLLSFTAFEGYSTNYQLQQSATASQLTALQALVIYSIQRGRTSFNLQYHPYMWFTQHTTYKDFAANSVDLDTSHNFSRAWTLSLADAFRYSPQLANSLGGAYSADFGTATSSSTPFLNLDARYWTNAANINVDHQLSESSHLTFNLTDTFVRISDNGSTQTPPIPLVGPNEENMYGGGVAWTRQWSRKNTLRLSYNYRRQQTPAAYGNTNYHLLDVGYTRILKPTLTVSLQAGPGFLSGNHGAFHSTTAQGSVTLNKAFRSGGVAISANRNVDYSGIVSDSLNNRYDLSVTRRLFRRVTFTATGSYLQQEFVGRPTVDGALAWGELNYRMTHMWSVFGGYRYFHTTAELVPFAPQHFVSFGIRWAWEPEVSRK